jgi:hypothetical protein
VPHRCIVAAGSDMKRYGVAYYSVVGIHVQSDSDSVPRKKYREIAFGPQKH